MRKILIAFLFIMSWGFTTSTAQKLPPQKETLEVMIKVVFHGEICRLPDS